MESPREDVEWVMWIDMDTVRADLRTAWLCPVAITHPSLLVVFPACESCLTHRRPGHSTSLRERHGMGRLISRVRKIWCCMPAGDGGPCAGSALGPLREL